MKSKILIAIIISFIGFSCSKQDAKPEFEKPTPSQPDPPKVVIKTNEEFAAEVKAYQKVDNEAEIKKGNILFIGTSAIKRCVDIADRFVDYHIKQRALTDCETSNIIYYADQLILPHKPSLLFVYNGEDDIVNGKSVKEAFDQFVKLANLVSKELPQSKACYIAIKPSPGRNEFQKSFNEYNKMIRSYIDQQGCSWTYLDTYTPLLDASGKANTTLYNPDKITLNNQGYDIWERVIKQYLEM